MTPTIPTTTRRTRSINSVLTFDRHEGAPCSSRQRQGSGDRGTAPMGDWSVKRLGGNIPEAMVDLRTKVGMSVAAASGVPVALVEALATGIGQREAWRRFTLTSCAAAWTIIADEVEAKMGVRPELDLSPAYGSDLTGRAAAVQKLVAATVPVGPGARRWRGCEPRQSGSARGRDGSD